MKILRQSVYSIVVAMCCAHTIFGQDPYQDLNAIVSELENTAAGSAPHAILDRLRDNAGNIIVTEGVDGDVRRNVLVLTISKNGGGANRVNILVVGTFHAREWVSYRVVNGMLTYILNNRTEGTWPVTRAEFNHFRLFREMNINALTDNANIFFIPVANPEGYHYSKSNDKESPYKEGQEGWRKNRRDNTPDPVPAGKTPIEPMIGVDLDRNFLASNWGEVTWLGSTQTTSQLKWLDTYCGRPRINWEIDPIRPPRVERETEGVVNLATRTPFVCLIDVHSYRGTVGWTQYALDARTTLRPSGGIVDSDVFAILAAKAASMIINPEEGKKTEYVAEQSPYTTSGTIDDWQYEQTQMQCYTYLIEVGKSNFRPESPGDHALAVLPGALFMMFASIDRSFSYRPEPRFRKPGTNPGD